MVRRSPCFESVRSYGVSGDPFCAAPLPLGSLRGLPLLPEPGLLPVTPVGVVGGGGVVVVPPDGGGDSGMLVAGGGVTVLPVPGSCVG
jgi:hypothetical protein